MRATGNPTAESNLNLRSGNKNLNKLYSQQVVLWMRMIASKTLQEQVCSNWSETQNWAKEKQGFITFVCLTIAVHLWFCFFASFCCGNVMILCWLFQSELCDIDRMLQCLGYTSFWNEVVCFCWKKMKQIDLPRHALFQQRIRFKQHQPTKGRLTFVILMTSWRCAQIHKSGMKEMVMSDLYKLVCYSKFHHASKILISWFHQNTGRWRANLDCEAQHMGFWGKMGLLLVQSTILELIRTVNVKKNYKCCQAPPEINKDDLALWNTNVTNIWFIKYFMF